MPAGNAGESADTYPMHKIAVVRNSPMVIEVVRRLEKCGETVPHDFEICWNCGADC